MKLFVLGLDCAAPEILLGDARLVNFRRMMGIGSYGRLESINPPITVPAWMSLATSQDPGSLGVYGFRNRRDYSYGNLEIASARSIQEVSIWDQVAREGKQSIIVGVPPSYPPRKVNGVCVSCFLTPDPSKNVFTYPASVQAEIAKRVGEYAVDVKGFRTNNKDWLLEQIYAMSRKQFQVVADLMQNHPWDYIHFVEIGLDRLQHGFWQYHDPQHVLYERGNPYPDVIRDYYLYLDYELGKLLELFDDDTLLLVVSDHGAQRLDGGFCVNEWLIQEGLLVLNEYPSQVTPFDKLSVDWDKTKVWSEGGYYARVFFNVKGREPRGVVDPADYEKFRDEVQAKFEAILDDKGNPMGTRAFKPQEIYQTVRNIAPDLIVHFGGLYWRSIGGVGYPTLHTQENDTGPDGCNHAPFGSFILAAPNLPSTGEIQGARLLDIAPTLLELGGYDVPNSMQGKTFIDSANHSQESVFSNTDETLLKEQLSGLGYIS